MMIWLRREWRFITSLLGLLLSAGCGGPGVSVPADDTVEQYPDEQRARSFEEAWIVPHWDRLRAAQHSPESFAAVLAGIGYRTNNAPSSTTPTIAPITPVTPVTPPLVASQRRLKHGIQRIELKSGLAITTEQARKRLLRLGTLGINIVHSDWHQESVRELGDGGFESVVRCNIHAKQGERRLRLRGRFAATWNAEAPENPTSLRWLDGERTERSGPPSFVVAYQTSAAKTAASARPTLGGLACADLNGDALPDFAIGNINRRFMNQGGFKFESLPLSDSLQAAGDALDALVFADFTGDRVLDLVGNRANGELVIVAGDADGGGGFSGPALSLVRGGGDGGGGGDGDSLALPPMRNIYCLSAGDIDGDGDLDLFAGQWLSPYERMPEVYHDALDAPPNVLLRNDGGGAFTDITDASGLAAKAARRTYSASLVDLDDDHDLDLWMVSDFAGSDVFRNDGGRFTDITETALPARGDSACFGMAHAMADFNRDGKLDVFTTGMGSTTARRLNAMASRDGGLADPMRGAMGYGNRMFLGGEPLRYANAPFSDAVARTGWSWGTVAFDIDNDRDEDLYVANGHISGDSTRDYCTHFWCSDVRHGAALQEAASFKPYLARLGPLDRVSWDGFQANALLLNDAGQSFAEHGFLLDLGYTHDARCLVASDLDRDGNVDLILTEEGGTSGFSFQNRPELAPARCWVIQNKGTLRGGNNWIGLQLGIGPKHQPQGARVDVFGTGTDGRTFHVRKVIVSGDSYKSQQPTEVHVGLGSAKVVDRMVITWPGGVETVMPRPAVNVWHAIGLKAK